MSVRPADVSPSPILLVGLLSDASAALIRALDGAGLRAREIDAADVLEAVSSGDVSAVVLGGDPSQRKGDVEALSALGVPAVLVSERVDASARRAAFDLGALGVVPLNGAPDTVARHLSRLVRAFTHVPSPPVDEEGELTVAELISHVEEESRSGLLSIRPPSLPGSLIEVEVLEGEGAEAAESLRAKLKPLRAGVSERLRYSFRPSKRTGDRRSRPSLATFGDLRLLLVDDGSRRFTPLAQELRAGGATVLVTDTQGRALEKASGLDPQVVIVDAQGLDGDGFEVVRALRAHPRLKWGAILAAPWDEIWAEGKPLPDLAALGARVEPLLAGERELVSQVMEGEPFDVRLDPLGPCRILRALASTGATLRARVRSAEASIDVDLASELIVAASTERSPWGPGEGVEALTALLQLGSGRVQVERPDQTAPANVMSPVEAALERAAAPLAPSSPSSWFPPPRAEASAKDATMRSGWGVPVADIRRRSRPPQASDSSPPERMSRTSLASRPSELFKRVAAEPSAPAPENLPIEASVAAVDSSASVADDLGDERAALPPPAGDLAEGASGAADADEVPVPVEVDETEPEVSEKPQAEPAASAGPPDDRTSASDGDEPPSGASEAERTSAPAVAPAETPRGMESAVAPPTSSRRGLGVAALIVSAALLGAVGMVLWRASGDEEAVPTPASASNVESSADRSRASERRGRSAEAPARTGEPPPAERPSEPDTSRRPDGERAPDSPPVAEPMAATPSANAPPEESPEIAADPVAAAPVAAERERSSSVEEGAPAGDAESTEAERLVALARQAGDSDLAERLYQQALELDPREHHAMVGYGRLLLSRERYAEALEQFRGAVRRRPRRASYRVWLGDALRGLGNEAAARHEWVRALTLNPDNRLARRRLDR